MLLCHLAITGEYVRSRTITKSTIFFCLFFAGIADAKHLGTIGRVYPVAERDALSEIREAASRVDSSKSMSQEMIRTKVHDFRPNTLHPLPSAKADKVLQVDMTYTLASDIPDGNGGVLYPKGFAFNPLDYVGLTSTLVVIDAEDKRQVEWFKASPYGSDYHTRLLLSGGDYYDLAEQLKRPVFYLMDDVAERLHLAAVPSVVRQNGKKLEVTEVLISDE